MATTREAAVLQLADGGREMLLQHKRNAPYSTLSQAFQSLVRL
jgi:hypothetical protein